jgi:Putative Flp pilus-assembly TadE/G-like
MTSASKHQVKLEGGSCFSAPAFVRDHRGSVFVNFALMAPVLLLLAGGVIDYSSALSERNVAQQTADAAALAGAKALSMADGDKASVAAIVDSVVDAHKRAGTGRTNDRTYDVSAKTIDESGSPLQVEVTLRSTTKPIFGGGLGLAAFDIEARSVAVVIGQPNVCLLALNPSAMGTIYLQKNAKIVGQNCSIYSNSTHPNGIKSFDSSFLKATNICSAGGKSGNSGNFEPEPLTDCPQFEDPLAGRPEPTHGGCVANNLVVDSVTTTLSPGTYCGGLTLKGSAVVKLSPGVFTFQDGPLLVSDSASLQGENVGFYFKGASSSFTFETGSSIDLTAPKDGIMAGMLMFASRSQSGLTHKILSDNARQLLGTIYLPTGSLSIDANAPIADQSAYTAIVADMVTGNSGPTVTLNTNYDATDVPVPDGIRGAGQPVALAQ